MTSLTSTLSEPLDHRRRLMEAMAHVVAVQGYASVTIADLAARAHVSKRTFYEHFDTKDECLIALYDAANEQAHAVLKAAVDPAAAWPLRIEQAMSAYFATLASHPVLLHTLFVEILGIGPTGIAARRRTQLTLAGLIGQTVHQPGGPALTMRQTTAIVGAINEWVLDALHEQRLGMLDELVGPTVDLVRAVAEHR